MTSPHLRIAVRMLVGLAIALAIPACAHFGGLSKPKTEAEIAQEKAEIEAGRIEAAKPLLWSPKGGAMYTGGAKPSTTP